MSRIGYDEDVAERLRIEKKFKVRYHEGNMRIAFIGQKGVGVVSGAGGIERHVTEIATRLVKRGHEVTVYARSRYLPDRPKRFEGVHIVYLPTVYRKNLEAILHTFLSTLHALQQPYDIYHYHGVGPATLSWMPRLFRPKAKVIVTFHSQDRFHQKWSWFARNYLHFGEWASVHFPHACIAVSHVLQVYCRNVYHRQVIYIPNGAEVQQDTATDELKEFGLKPDEYILNVGRIVPQKGLQFLIAAYDKLDTQKKLLIVGDPSFSERYAKELRRQASGNSGVIFLGHQSGEPLRQLYAHAYLYVQPSESEGLALVVLEAMSFGRAVLVSDIPENVEAIKNTGFLFANRDSEDLAAQLRKLINHPELVHEMGGRAQELVRRAFNWDMITVHTEEVYLSERH